MHVGYENDIKQMITIKTHTLKPNAMWVYVGIINDNIYFIVRKFSPKKQEVR